jgi:hypothetical protein
VLIREDGTQGWRETKRERNERDMYKQELNSRARHAKRLRAKEAQRESEAAPFRTRLQTQILISCCGVPAFLFWVLGL